jgi:phosphatidylserine decarboxylase
MPHYLTIPIRERGTNSIVEERVFADRILRFLYAGPFGLRMADLVVGRRFLSEIYACWQRRGGSRKNIARFCQELGIDISEAEFPLSHYRSTEDFFMRRLKPGARPVDQDPRHLVSPADGRALVYAPLAEQPLRVKGSRLRIAELLGSEQWAQPYRGGTAIIVRLAAADYHRFHFPESGVASAAIEIPGPLYHVHPVALAAGAPIFRNKRSLTWLQTERWGTIAIVEIGAFAVGTIVQTYQPGPVQRGQEKGFFRLGGSTVVILVEAGKLQPDEDLVAASAEGMETLVKMGTRLGQAPAGV